MKKILITGASGGIGQAIVKALSNKQHQLFLHSHKKQGLEQSHKYLLADFTKQKSVIALANKLKKDGGVDIIIHCVSLPTKRAEIHKKDWKDFENHFNLQVRSLFLLTKELLEPMKMRKFGKIINILTEYTVGKPPSQLADYITAKYALLGFSKALAVEYGKYNISCNCVSPGLTDTHLTADLPLKLKEIIAAQTPLKRLTQTKDTANLIKFLCSDETDFITGENILINGGYTMS